MSDVTRLDPHPLDPREARLKLIAALVLMSELGMVRSGGAAPAKPAASRRAAGRPRPQPARGGARLVRPPRSC